MRWPAPRSVFSPVRQVATPQSAGFTLLEVMVVMTIIAIIAGMVALRVGDSSRQVRHEHEARRLQQAVQLAAQEAIVRGRQYGLAVEADGYGFCRRENGAWRAIEKDSKLRPYQISGGLTLRVDSTLPDQGGRQRDEEETACPMVRLMPSGEIEPIRIAVVEGDGRAIIDVDVAVTGKVTRTYRQDEADSP
jgi:general secretion pathway protein H